MKQISWFPITDNAFFIRVFTTIPLQLQGAIIHGKFNVQAVTH